MSDESISNDVRKLIAEELAVDEARLHPSTSLFHDLGVDGAEGWEFMELFGERFGVDLSAFEPGLHFGPEAGCNPLVWLLSARPLFIPITPHDLEHAAATKVWKTPSSPPR